MNWVSFTALFFVTWWLVLFAVLPFSLRTQDEDKDVTLGTVPSAPRGPHMLRAAFRTTVATLVLLGIFYGITRGLGLGIDDIPHIVPDFNQTPKH
jgi:predicted secreted protein